MKATKIDLLKKGDIFVSILLSRKVSYRKRIKITKIYDKEIVTDFGWQ